MEKTAAERLKDLAEILSQKAEEIKMKTQGVETDVSTRPNKTTSE